MSDAHTIAVDHLAVLNRLGAVGADGVANRLRGLLATETTVRTTAVRGDYVGPTTVPQGTDGRRVGVRVPLLSAPNGVALLLMTPESANRAAGLLLRDAEIPFGDADEEMAWSALTELGAMVVSGYLDTWADSFGGRIDVGSPAPVSGEGRELLTGVVTGTPELGLSVVTRHVVEGHGITFDLYLFPKTETFVEVLARVTPEMVEA